MEGTRTRAGVEQKAFSEAHDCQKQTSYDRSRSAISIASKAETKVVIPAKTTIIKSYFKCLNVCTAFQLDTKEQCRKCHHTFLCSAW